MSGLQWLFIIGLGVAGYVLVSFVIDKVKGDATPTQPTGGEAPPPMPVPPPAQSAWEEFSQDKRERM